VRETSEKLAGVDPAGRRVVVRSLRQALAAAEAAAALGVPLVLESAEGAVAYAGIGWFAGLRQAVRERHPSLDLAFVLDCGDEAGTAMAALRRGFRRVRFSGPPAVAEKLRQMGLGLETGNAGAALDLGHAMQPEDACRKFLAADASAR
jgi:hypothetical protein